MDKRQIRVLHVDDMSSELEMADFYLRDCDSSLDIDTTTSPDKAIELVTNSGYDCLVTDYKMPEINGIELTKLIREKSDIPIIMFTGWGDESIAAAGYKVGLNGYIMKNSDPNTYRELASQIRKLVEALSYPSSPIRC